MFACLLTLILVCWLVQKRQTQENPKNTNSKYNSQDDTNGTAHNVSPREDDNQMASRQAVGSKRNSSGFGQRHHTSKGSESVRSSNRRCSQLDVSEPSDKQEWTSSTYKQSEGTCSKEAMVVIN